MDKHGSSPTRDMLARVRLQWRPWPRTQAKRSRDAHAVQLPIEGELPSLGGATAWLNSPPLSAADLRGKVVLIDFWTYTCINWLRTLPYVRAWAEKYRDHGVVVIGVHTPEFPLSTTSRTCAGPPRTCGSRIRSRSITTMRSGALSPTTIGRPSISSMRRGIFAIITSARAHTNSRKWCCNTCWPRRASAASIMNWSRSMPRVPKLPLIGTDLRSPETYVGYERAEHFASPGGAVLDKRRVYTAPARLRLNHWALAGEWTVGRGATVLNKANGRITYRFHARDLHLVMGPAARGTSVRFRVLIDGRRRARLTD